MVTKFEQRIKQLLGKSEKSDENLKEAARHVASQKRSERYELAESQAEAQAQVGRQGQLELLKAKLKGINASKIFVLERMIKTTVNERILYAQSEIDNGRSNVERNTPQPHVFDYSRLMNLKHPKGTPGYLPATANIRKQSNAEAKKIINKLKAEVDVHGNPKSLSNKQQDAYARRLYEFLNDAKVKNQRGKLETPKIYLGDNFKTNHGVNENGKSITKYKHGFVNMAKSPISSTQSDWLLLLFWDPDAGHALRSLSFDMQNELTKELENLKRRAERTKAGSGERAAIADEQRRINRDLKISENGLYFSRLLLTFHAAREEIGRTPYIDVTTETTSGEDFVSGGVLVEGRGQTPTRKPFQIDSHLPTVNLGGIQQNVARFKSIAEMFHGLSGFQESIGARSAAQIPASQLPYSTQAKLESDMLGGGDDLYDDRDVFSPAPSSLDDINLSDQPIGRDEDLAQRVAQEEGISIQEARQKVSYDIQNPVDAIEQIGRQMKKLFETGIVDSIIYRLTTEQSSDSDKKIKGRSVVLKRNPFGKDNIARNSLQAQIQKSLLSGILSSSQPKILNQLRAEKTNIPEKMAPSPEDFATAGDTLHVRGLLKRLDQLQQIPVKQVEVETFRGKSKYPEVTSVEMPTRKHFKTKRREPKYGRSRSMVSDDLITVLNEIETAQEYDAVMSALQSIYYEVNSPERDNKSNTPAKIAERLGGEGEYNTIIKELSQIMKHQVEGFHYQETSRKPGPSGQKRSLASWYMVVKQEKRKGNNYQLVPMKSTFESRLVTRTGRVIAGETNVPTRSLRLPPGAKVEQGGTRTHQDWVESRGQLDTTAEMELFDQMSNEELRKVYSDLKTESAKAFSNRAIRDLAKQKGITEAQAEAELLRQQPNTIRLGPGGLASPYDAATAQSEYIPPSPRRVPAKSYDNIPIGYTPSILQPDTDMTKVDPDFLFRDLVFNPTFTDEELKHRNKGKEVDKANLPQYRDIYSAYLGQQTFDLDAKLQIANASTIEEKVAILDRLAKHDKNAGTSDKKLVNASTWKNVRGRVMRTLVRMQMTVPQVASASAARTTLRTGKGQFQFAKTPLESDANQFWGQTTDEKDRPNRSDGNMYGQLHADARREMPGESRYGQDSIMPKDISTKQLASMMQDPSQWEFQPDGQRPIDNILDKVTYSQIKTAGIQLGLSEAELTLGNRTKDDIVRMVEDQLGLSIDTKPSPQAEEFIRVILTAFDDPDRMTEIPEKDLMGGGANNQIDIQTDDDISRIVNEAVGTGSGEPPKDPPPVAGGMEDDGINKIEQEIEDWLVNQGFKTKKKESIRRAIAAGNESYLANNLNKSQLKSLLLGMGKQPGPKATKKSMAAEILVTTGSQVQAVAPPPSSQPQPAVQPTTETVSGPSQLAPAPDMDNPLEGTRWVNSKGSEIARDLASGELSYGSLNEKERAFVSSRVARELIEDYERGVLERAMQESPEDVIRDLTGEQGNTITKVVPDAEEEAEEIRAKQEAATSDLSGPPQEIGNTLGSVLPIGDSDSVNRPDVSPTTDATTDLAIDPITGELLGTVDPGQAGPGQMLGVTPTTESVSAPPPNVNQPDVTPTVAPVSDSAQSVIKPPPAATPNVNPTTQSIPYGAQDTKAGDTGPTYQSQVKPPPGVTPTTAQVPDQQTAGQTTQSSQPSLNDVASQGETETTGKISRAANWTKDKVDQGSSFAKRNYRKAQAIQKSPLVSGATDIGEALSGFQTAAEWNKLSDLERAEAESSRTYDLSKGQYGSMEQLTSTMVSRNQISQQDADNLNRLASYIREDVKASPDAFNNRPENHPAWNHLMSSLRNATLNDDAYKGRTAVFRQPISYDDMSWKDQVVRGKETEGMFGSLREDLINKPMDIRDKVPEGLINVVGLSEATGQRQSISYLSDMVKQNIAYMATMNVTGSMKDSLSKWTNVALRKIPMEALGSQGAEVLGEEVIKYLKARKVKNLDKIVDGMKGMSATAMQELGERYGMKNVKETVKDGLIKKVAKFGLKGAVRVLEIPLMANHLRDEISAMTDPSMQGWQRSLRTTIGGAPIESEAGHEAVLMRPDAFTEVMAARSSGQYSNDQLQQMMYDGAPYSNVSMWSLDEDAGVVINNRTGTEVSLKEVNGRIPGYVKKYSDEKLRMLNMTALKFLGRSALDDEEAEQIRGRMMRTEFSDLTQSEVSELEKEFTTRGKGYTAGFSDDEMQGYDLLNPNENRINQRDAGWSYSFKKGGGLEGLDDRFTLKDLSDTFSEPTAQGESVVGKVMAGLIPDWDWNINPMSALSAAERGITRKTGDKGERLWKNRTMVFYPETTTAEGNVLPSKMQPYESGHIMDIGQHAEDIASPFTKSDAQRYGQYYIDPTDVGHIESEEQSKRRAQEFGGLAPPPAGALIQQPHWQGLR